VVYLACWLHGDGAPHRRGRGGPAEKSGDVRVSVTGGSCPMRSVGNTGIVLGSVGAGVGAI
jgi:hypothetical protein